MSGDAHTREKVLAVDDDEAFLLFEAEVLENHGVDVFTATSAEQALGILRSEPDVSLVLLDVALDGSSGLTLCRDIKSDRSLSSIPVMFVTGQVEPEEVTELVEAGADEFSLKPFRVQEFVIRVKALLRLGRRGRDLSDRAVSAERLADIRTTELDEMRRFAEGVVASLASGVAVVDSDLSVLFVNESFRRMFDREGDECTGSDLAEIAGDEFLSRAGLRELAADAVESGKRLGVAGIHLDRAGGEDSVVDVRVRAVAYGGTTHTHTSVHDHSHGIAKVVSTSQRGGSQRSHQNESFGGSQASHSTCGQASHSTCSSSGDEPNTACSHHPCSVNRRTRSRVHRHPGSIQNLGSRNVKNGGSKND